MINDPAPIVALIANDQNAAAAIIAVLAELEDEYLTQRDIARGHSDAIFAGGLTLALWKIWSIRHDLGLPLGRSEWTP